MVEPWPEPVDGSILLRAIKETIQRYVFMSEAQAVAVTLLVVFSWVHEYMTHSVILLVTSPEKNSGKTTLLGVLNFLVRCGLQSVSITGPALFRSIRKWMPSFVIDEADKALANNEDLCSVVNSGWTRGQGVIRCNPETHEPEFYSTFAFKVVAMKGRNLEDTTLSRAVETRMKRKRKGEHAAKFNHLDNETFARLRSQLLRWYTDNAEAIAKATPEIPSGFDNRLEDNWIPLMAIAEACGWKQQAWTAALAIEIVAGDDDPSTGAEVLRAINAVFEARAKAPKNADRIRSADLLSVLIADATARWATYNKGRPISERQVAKLLEPFEIKPKTVRFETKLANGTWKSTTFKGYLKEWFADAFARYCASSSPENVTDKNGGSGERVDHTEDEDPIEHWADLSPEVIEQIASGLRRTASTIRLDAEVRKRLARHGVPPEAEIIEVEKVFRRIDEMAEPVSVTSGSGQGEDRRRPKTTDGYDLIGAELPSTPCAHCGIADGNVLLIRDPRQGMRSTAALHDRCAKPHFNPEHGAPRRKARGKASSGNRRSPHKANPKSRRKAATKRK